MARFYTQSGDDGYTSLLGKGRVAKYAPRVEAIGTIDEANATIGLARAFCQAQQTAQILLATQRDLYHLMAEVAATPDNAFRFRMITSERVTWLEEQTDAITSIVSLPSDFILPGDSKAGAIIALARTIVRRSERHIAQLIHTNSLENRELLRYLNRLSSLFFALELLENQAAGKDHSTLAKG